MREDVVPVEVAPGKTVRVPSRTVHTLVVGSGAAGLNAALQLRRNGVKDILLLSEGFQKGTSINAGSDKQTYYKLGISGSDPDSPKHLAETLFSGGGMHGDIALVEAALSVQAFMNLVNLGVAFPHDTHGQYVGYKTDHDPMQRATSAGPYTSRDMCRYLHREIETLGIPFLENRLVISLVTLKQDGKTRIGGAIVLKTEETALTAPPESRFEIYLADNLIFAVGGPGGLYEASVYPEGHNGGIGLALLEGAEACNLTESQFGLASLRPRWNTSGSYMQVVPRIFSTAPDGTSNSREFLLAYLDDPADLNSRLFLKGYQWPFDVRKIDGSSLIDLLIYVETVIRKRRVFLDFRENPTGFSLDTLSEEARAYLANSSATGATPLKRLLTLNPDAVRLYRDKGVDLASEPLEIAVCAQHNNGGLAGNIWWESPNLNHFFPVGEVNGSHGVLRPGGTALNAGQVGGIRAAEFIAHRYREPTLNERAARDAATARLKELYLWLKKSESAHRSHAAEADEFRTRMTKAGGHIRSHATIGEARKAAWAQWRRLEREGCDFTNPEEWGEIFTIRHLCFAHAVYLDAAAMALESGVGSRGSTLVLGKTGRPIHPKLGDQWRYVPEDPAFREKVLKILPSRDGKTETAWVPRRVIPETEGWFETIWADFKKGKIFESP
ncbi:MAG: FAD-binding protein [Deltaproteobacteria bacterium]|nr:FAD-binding protein [Deltaproteobacteria bacterium]